MKRLLAALLALALAGQANAAALFIRCAPTGATQASGLDRIGEAAQGMANTLGGAYVVKNICDAPEGSTEALRDGKWWPNGVGVGTAETYGLVVLLGDDKGGYTGTKTTVSAQAGSGGFAYIRSGTATHFAYMQPGMIVSGTPITGTAVVVSVDSIYQKIRVKGTVAYSASFTMTWGTPIRPDSLTRSVAYPRVPILRLGQFMGITGGWTTSATCSTGVTQTATYSAYEDSTVNVYEVGNPYRSWKARQWYATHSPKDTRGFRAVLARVSTRKNEAGHANGNYDFIDPDNINSAFAYTSATADTVVLWMVQNRDATAGSKAPLGGDAKENIYAVVSTVNGTNSIDPGTVMTALALADSLSSGALFGSSGRLPRKISFGIDDGWRRADSRFGSTYGGISVNDTTGLKRGIDSLVTLRIPFVLGVELDSLDSVLMSDGVTAHGDLYDKRWWAVAEPWVKYSPHCHSGITGGVNRKQNVGTKYLRPIDIFGLSRNRLVFTSPDSMLAYGLPDYVNESTADTGSVYWLNKRAWFLCDSTFGRNKVDRQMIPAGGCWSHPLVTRTSALAVDSLITAFVAAGAANLRMLVGINMVGDATANTFGYYNTHRTMTTGWSGYPGMPAWMPSSVYGRQFDLVPIGQFRTDAAGGTAGLSSSVSSWSGSRNNYGGEANLWQLLVGKPFNTSAAQDMGYANNITLHASDFGSSGRSGEQTMPGFYTLKYVTNAIRVANAHARKDLVRIVYPEDVRP